MLAVVPESQEENSLLEPPSYLSPRRRTRCLSLQRTPLEALMPEGSRGRQQRRGGEWEGSLSCGATPGGYDDHSLFSQGSSSICYFFERPLITGGGGEVAEV